ncbi:fatty acid--CoA ligase [Pseudonocardia eucalypti]|uniref:Fatty acid--CoA ligase n=1 Tax=Pseudonocardia eucalypti TaxID=648755 RepID=A0ABP9PPI5_9PSEU|nr:long-chain acyl-CoA synthetase [Pseudonocardia eucalypti]
MTGPTLAGVIRRHAKDRADHPAVWYDGGTLSYARLGERTDRVAAGLAEARVRPGDRVAVLSRNHPSVLEVLLGAAKLGAVTLPVNWRLAGPEIAYIVDHAEARVLVVGPEFTDTIADIAPGLPRVRTVLGLGTAGRYPSYEDWLAGQPATDPGHQPHPDDVVVQMYTSGTTGRPKGVQLTNAGLLGRMGELCRFWHYDADSVNLVAMPLFHIGGTGAALLSLLPGATTVLLPEVDPVRIARTITEQRVTNVFLVPTVIQSLLDTPGAGDWSSLRVILYGASPISDTVLRRAMDRFGCDFVHLYGITECGGSVSQLEPRYHDPENRPDLLRSCGRPLPWNEVLVADPDTSEPVAAGRVGEILVRSPQNMLGYWRQDAATAEAFTADGYFRTGDAGYFDRDGFLYLHDRIKDMIVSGAENVYPAEIENVIAGHPDVADVAVIGVPHERWGETPKALVVPRPGAAIDPAELLEFCRRHLAGFKCPTSVDTVKTLPRNPSGKLLKHELREPYWAGKARRVN